MTAQPMPHVEAVLAWLDHMVTEHPLLCWLGFSYLVCSVLAIVALACAVSA